MLNVTGPVRENSWVKPFQGPVHCHFGTTYTPATSNDRLQPSSILQQGYGRQTLQRRHINPAQLKLPLPPA
jgi:hypothetical protein